MVYALHNFHGTRTSSDSESPLDVLLCANCSYKQCITMCFHPRYLWLHSVEQIHHSLRSSWHLCYITKVYSKKNSTPCIYNIAKRSLGLQLESYSTSFSLGSQCMIQRTPILDGENYHLHPFQYHNVDWIPWMPVFQLYCRLFVLCHPLVVHVVVGAVGILHLVF